MNTGTILKPCYFCDYPHKVCADYETRIYDDDDYYGGFMYKYKDLWVCYICSFSQFHNMNFSVQTLGDCCICYETKALLRLPTCQHSVCASCCKTIYYGTASTNPPSTSLNDIKPPTWPYAFHCSYEDIFAETRKDWMIVDDKEMEYGQFSNTYFNKYSNPELQNKTYEELIEMRDLLIAQQVEKRADWMNTETFIQYENALFQYEISANRINKAWAEFNAVKTRGNGICPLCRAEP